MSAFKLPGKSIEPGQLSKYLGKLVSFINAPIFVMQLPSAYHMMNDSDCE